LGPLLGVVVAAEDEPLAEPAEGARSGEVGGVAGEGGLGHGELTPRWSVRSVLVSGGRLRGPRRSRPRWPAAPPPAGPAPDATSAPTPGTGPSWDRPPPSGRRSGSRPGPGRPAGSRPASRCP